MSSNLNLLIILVPIIGAVIVNIIVALKTNNKVSEVSAKADIISGHVNGAATTANAKIESMTREITELKQLLSDNKEIAALLAQSAAKREI